MPVVGVHYRLVIYDLLARVRREVEAASLCGKGTTELFRYIRARLLLSLDSCGALRRISPEQLHRKEELPLDGITTILTIS